MFGLCCCNQKASCDLGPRPEEALWLLDLTGIANYHPPASIGASGNCYEALTGAPTQACSRLNTAQVPPSSSGDPGGAVLLHFAYSFDFESEILAADEPDEQKTAYTAHVYSQAFFQSPLSFTTYDLTLYVGRDTEEGDRGVGPWAKDTLLGINGSCIDEDFRLSCWLQASGNHNSKAANLALYRNATGDWTHCRSECCEATGTILLVRLDNRLRVPVVTAVGVVEPPTVT